MSEFKVNNADLKRLAGDLEQISKSLDKVQDDVANSTIKISLSLSYIDVNDAIKTISGEINVERKNLAAFSSTLEKVAQLYASTEKDILNQDGKEIGHKPDNGEKGENKGDIEKLLETLEEIIGHDAMSFITLFIEGLSKVEGIGMGFDITAGILDALNYMIDDLQDGATINSLYANMIVSATGALLAMGAGVVVEEAITGAITAACAGATGGVGAAVAPFAAVIGKICGTGASIVAGHTIDAFNEADWDRDGESNREEISHAVEKILDWRNPYGNDHTFYLPEGI